MTGVDGVRYDDPLTLSVDFLLPELAPVASRNVVRDEDLLIPLVAPAADAEATDGGRLLPLLLARLGFGLRSREVTISSRKSSTDCASSPDAGGAPEDVDAFDPALVRSPAWALPVVLLSALGSPSKLSRLSRNCSTSSRCERVVPPALAPGVRVEGVDGRDMVNSDGGRRRHNRKGIL